MSKNTQYEPTIFKRVTAEFNVGDAVSVRRLEPYRLGLARVISTEYYGTSAKITVKFADGKTLTANAWWYDKIHDAALLRKFDLV